MSLRIKLGTLILLTLLLLAGSLSLLYQNTRQIEEIASRRRFGQIMLSTSDKLGLGKLVLQSELPETSSTVNQLLNDIFLMQTAVNTSLRLESQPEIVGSLQSIQLDLPAITLLLKDVQTRLAGSGKLTREDTLKLDQLDSFVSKVEIVVQNYDQYLKTEAERIEQVTRVYTYLSITIMFLVIGTMSLIIYFNVLRPIGILTHSAEEIAKGNYNHQTHIRSKDEFGQLGDAFTGMASELRVSISNLEQRVADRTKALGTSTEVSRRLSTILNEKELVNEVVTQVNNAFDYYHTQIYFYDEASENLVMAGGTGEAGEKMLARGHKISKGNGLVGRAAESNRTLLVSDVSEHRNWLPNPLLPETKSEVAIPISIGGQVLGVLDVQQNTAGGLMDEDADVLESIANQVAIALQNTRQFESARKIAADLRVVANMGIATSTITEAGHLLQEAVDLTKKSFNLYHAHIYQMNEAGNSLELTAGAGDVGRQMVSEKRSIPLDSEQSLVARAARTQVGVVVNDVTLAPDFLPNPLLPATRSEIAVPMLSGGKVIGVLDMQSEAVNRFSETDISIQTTLASQVAAAWQNARSFSQSQRQVERETAVNLITQKIQNTTSIDSALQVTVRELGRAMGMKQTAVSLEPAAMTEKNKALKQTSEQ